MFRYKRFTWTILDLFLQQKKSYKYLYTIVDAFSKFTWIYPVKSTNADEVVQKLRLQSEVFGNPRRLITDRGAAFSSNLFRDYCYEQKIQHILTTTGVPRSNGQVERINQAIISILSKISVDEPQKWWKHVPRLQRVMNSTKTRATNRTPFELMIGVPMYNPEDLKLAQALEEEMVENFEESRMEMRKEAKKQIEVIQEENRKTYNRKRKPAHKYNVHDLVAIKRIQFGPGLKLYPKFLGPYEIIKIKGKDRYNVRKIGDHEGPNTTSSSADFMKPWAFLEDEDDDESSGSDEFQDGRMWDPDQPDQQITN